MTPREAASLLRAAAWWYAFEPHAAAILSRAADLCDVWVGLQLPPWVAAGRALAAVPRYRRSARRWLLLTRIAPSDPREPEALTRARAHLFAAAVLRLLAD